LISLYWSYLSLPGALHLLLFLSLSLTYSLHVVVARHTDVNVWFTPLVSFERLRVPYFLFRVEFDLIFLL
jgi:hypothetical protein